MAMGIPFEAHLTVEALTSGQLPAFEAFCIAQGAKPLLIELARGEHQQQPMASFVWRFSGLREARNLAASYLETFAQAHFPVCRIKLEIPPDFVDQIQEAAETTRYYEWHGLIALGEGNSLENICAAHQAHISSNALKDDLLRRFVTLREYGNRTAFENRKSKLIENLTAAGWTLHKQQSEYCVYDSKVALDAGWLTPTTNWNMEEIDPQYLIQVAYEGLIRRVAQLDHPTMLKGSFLTRQ